MSRLSIRYRCIADFLVFFINVVNKFDLAGFGLKLFSRVGLDWISNCLRNCLGLVSMNSNGFVRTSAKVARFFLKKKQLYATIYVQCTLGSADPNVYKT